ncbi:MAG: trigger factor [Dehalococcoidia bacterium]|nr:MAG: trigger factor [Dehalococcoidia bacterium]
MKSTAKTIEHCQAELHIEAEQPEYEAAQTEAFKYLAGRVEIPGFRKGKAPRPLVEKHVGRDAVVEEAIERLFPDLYEEALTTHDLHPITTPHVHLEEREPPVFLVVVPLEPEVELGDYRSVRVTPEEVSVTDEHVLSALDRMRESQAVLVPAERPLRFGDFASIDVKATVDGQPFLDHKAVTYEVVAKSPMPLPGFPEAIVEMSGGESKDLSLTIPEDFRVTELAGKECACSVTVQQVREKELPELGDGMAQAFGFDTLEALRERVGADLELNARNQARTALIHKALEAITAQGHVDFPPVLEEREIDDLLAGEAKRYGYKTVEDYLQMASKSMEEIRVDLRPLAHERIVNGLILSRLAKTEGIEIADNDVDSRVEELLAEAQDKNRVREILATPQMRESLADRLRTNRTLDRLVAIATGEADAVPETATDTGAASAPEVEDTNG